MDKAFCERIQSVRMRQADCDIRRKRSRCAALNLQAAFIELGWKMQKEGKIYAK